MNELSALERPAALEVWSTEMRRANTLDILLIGALAHRIWQQHYASILPAEQISHMLDLMYSPEALYEQMADGHEFWIIEADGLPVGYASLSQEEEDGHWHLHKIYVSTEKQRHGLGSRMLEHIRQLYRPSRLTVCVNRQNYKAVNFYFANGFTIEGIKDADIGGGFVMEDFILSKEFH